MRSTRIVVFAKAPQPGAAKTRLIPVLGPEGAADLARRMLTATLGSALHARIGPVELCTTPEPGAPAWRGVPLPDGTETRDQGGGDLGARLARAARRVIGGGEPVILIGTDCIEMSAALLREAAVALDETGTVIYLTADGGYALLGLTQFDARLFESIPWSTARAGSETITRLGALSWPLHVGCVLHDVDEPRDLEGLPRGWPGRTAPLPGRTSRDSTRHASARHAIETGAIPHA